MRRNLVPVAPLAAYGERCLAEFREWLRAIPDGTLNQLTAETNPAVIHALLDNHVRRVLRRIADMREIWEAPLCAAAT